MDNSSRRDTTIVAGGFDLSRVQKPEVVWEEIKKLLRASCGQEFTTLEQAGLACAANALLWALGTGAPVSEWMKRKGDEALDD